MSGTRTFRGLLAGLAIMACLPTALSAEPAATAPSPLAVDIALGEDGLLVGQVVNTQGVALPRMPVYLRAKDRELAAAATNEKGVFAVRGLRGGVCQLSAGQTTMICRLWAPGTAPQSAKDAALVVVGGQTARGQIGGVALDMVGDLVSEPLVATGAIAAGVGVPVGLHLGKRPASP